VNLCTVSTNGTTNSTSVVGNLQGIGRAQFVRVSDGNYDYQTGQFYNPVTNQYLMVLTRNGQANTVVFQRVVTTPDFVFAASDQVSGPGAIPVWGTYTRNINFNQANAAANLAGPGTIDPSSTITYNKSLPVYYNSSPSYLTGPNTNTQRSFIWGSFDGTTNTPIVYPNGTSIANLAAEAFIQISPATLPDGTNGVPYNVVLSATGGQSPYSWALYPGSNPLPTGLTLSSGGVISGTPTASGTFDDIVIQMTDTPLFNKPAYSVQMIYSLVIN
jgi:hypothetical protein